MTTIGTISNVICGPFGTAIKNSDYQEKGIPLIRIRNISKDGYMDYSDIVCISEQLGNTMKRTQVSPGDIVISQRGSLGQCAVVDNNYQKLNISANIIAIKNIKHYSAEFIRDYILSSLGRSLLERNISGQVQPKITTQDISDIIIPIGCDEKKLITLIQKSHEAKIKKIKKANECVAITRKQLFHQLNIDFPEYTPHLFSFTKLADVQKLGMYCNPHSAYLRKVFLQLSNHSWYHGILKDFVDINPPIDKTELTNETKVSFVPMTNVGEKNNKVLYEIKDYQEVKTGFTPFMKGDLLWAKITPCMQNGKSFIADNMPTKHGFGSTEFHVLRLKNENLYLPYLWVILSDSNILEAAQGMFSGSAGQQRVTDVFLENFPVVLPPYNLQIELADKVFSSLQEADVLTQQAEQEWQEAKKQFENELLGE